MANSFVKSKSRLDKSLPNIQAAHCKDDLHAVNAKLKMSLQSEQNSLKQLRREMTLKLKKVHEEEHQKSVLIQKDLKSRLHFEKVKELEHQRGNLNKKFDCEQQKLTKLKDGEIKKLRNDVKKLQDELQLVASATSNNTTSGLSVNVARDTFESERVKLHKEIQDLQVCKRNLESEVTFLREHEKKLNYSLKKIKEDHTFEVTKLRKDADVEVRKLLDELKSKHRQLSQSHQDCRAKCIAMEAPGSGAGAASASEKRKSPHSSNSSGDDQGSASDLPGKSPVGSASWTPKISDLSSKLKHSEEKCKTLEEEKQKLQVRLKEAGRKHRPLLEKNKKFLEKNMELSSVNRSLEDRIRDISHENEKLKHDLEKQEKTITLRRHSVPVEGIGELTSDEMAKELKTFQRQGIENDKTIAALKLACAEKDRRIELILHRKRKQRTSKAQNKAAGIKETYFGYDEADSNSVDDSEMSLSICSSVDMLDDEDVFEEFTREEFEANYQRLVKEHLELERSFSQLQESIGHSQVDPQRGNKLKSQLESDLLDAQSRIEDLEKLVKNQGQKSNYKEDTGWIEEKEKLNKNIRTLKEKIVSRDDKDRRLNFQLEEVNEQNEVLEFRTLELEEQCEKLQEQLGSSVTFSGDLSLSDSGVLQMCAEEKGILEVNVSDLKESLEVLKRDHATTLSTDEKITLVQSLALVDIADKKLKDLTNTVEALKSRIKLLEEEKADILSKEEGITTDLVLEYEATRNQLIELQLKCSQLENECQELEKAKAVHNYKETHFDKLEVSYRDEITQLKRRLSSASEGRGYENEVFQDKLTQLKGAEKKLSELTQENHNHQACITELQRECVDLHEQLTIQQDTLSLTESDKDTLTHNTQNLQCRMSDQYKMESEPGEKIHSFEDKIAQLKNTNKSLEKENNILRNSTSSLENTLEELEETNSDLKKDVLELKTAAKKCAISELKLKEDNVQLRHVVQDLSDSSRQVEDELEAKQNELADFESKFIEFESQNGELALYKDKCKKLEQDLSATQDEMIKIQSLLSDKDSLKNGAVNNCQNLSSTGASQNKNTKVFVAECETQTLFEETNYAIDTTKLEELESEILELMTIISEKDQSLNNFQSNNCSCERLKSEICQLKNDGEEKEALIIESMDTINLLQDRLKQYENWKADAEEKISEIDALQEALIDLEQNNSQFKLKIKQQEKDIAEFTLQLEDKDTEIQNLKECCDKVDLELKPQCGIAAHDYLINEIEEKDMLITSLQTKVISLEKSDQESAKKILELLDAKSHLNIRIKHLEEHSKEEDTEELRFQVEQLEKGKHKLQQKVQELEDLLEEEVNHTTQLEQQLSKLEPIVKQNQDETNEKPIVTFKLQTSDDENTESTSVVVKQKVDNKLVNNNLSELELKESQEREVVLSQIMELQQQLETANEDLRCSHEELVLVDEEKSERIDTLQDRIHTMEENELKLSETVLELEEIEKELRQKVQVYEKNSFGKNSQVEELDKTYDNQLKKLTLSEQNLKDTLVQMSNNEKLLRDRLSEVEEKLQRYEQESSSNGSDSDEVLKTQDLKDAVKEYADKEEKLLEEIYKVKLENKELQDHIDQLIEEKGEDSSFEQQSQTPTSPSGTNDKIKELQSEVEQLKDQLLKSKLDAIKTVQDSGDFPEGYNSLGDLQNRLKDLENEESKLKEHLSQVESDKNLLNEENKQLKEQIYCQDSQNETEKKLKDKLDVLQDSETKLMDNLCEVEEENEQLKEQVERLSERIADSQGSSEELQVKISQMRKREQGLLHVIETIKEKQEKMKEQGELSSAERKELDELRERVNVQSSAEKRELDQLTEKVDILLDSESKLMDRIEEKEEQEDKLKHQLEKYKESLQQHQLEKVEVTEKLKRLQILEEMQEGNAKLQDIAQQRIVELEESEKELKSRLNSSEQQGENPDIDYATQNSYLEKQLLELESVVEDYETQIQQNKVEQEELADRLNEYEDNEKSLKTKVNELKVKNSQLSISVQSMQDNLSKQGQNTKEVFEKGQRDHSEQDRSLLISELQTSLEEQITPESSHEKLRSILPSSVENYISSHSNVSVTTPPFMEAQLTETLRQYSPVDSAAVDDMSREEMISKIHELQEMENFHRAKICEMKEHINYFRQAVEVVAVALEADAEVPLLKMRPKALDSDFEARVNELVKSEVKLKLKVLELEKRETNSRRKLEEVEGALKEKQIEFRGELDNIEDQLNTARKNEARFKNKLQYGNPGQEPQALIRIQELEEQVFDLQTTESKFKRELQDLKESELQLKYRLEDVDTEGRNGLLGPLSSTLRKSTEDKDKYWDLLGQIKTLESSEKELKDRVEELKKEDVDSLVKRISDLERSEKGLKLKLQLIEGEEPSFLETVDLSMLDSPEAILKQRVKELETMERHLKQQVGELEKDREELHEIARKDKNMIHELNVHIRELQLSERNLRDQLNRYDLEDSKLHSNLDDLKDENEEMREELQKLQSRERSLNAQLQKLQYQETDVSLQLENTKQDMKLAEDKLRKKLHDLEQEKRQLREKADELTDRLGDLEGTEISLKQKLRHTENNETQLKTRIADLEQSENSSTSRISDLESLNEILNDKVHKLEEDKSGMMYDVSSLQFSKEEMEHEVERLQAQVKGLRTRLEDIEMRKSAMQQRLDDYNAKEVEMHNKLQDLERCDKEWRDRIQFLEHNEEKLRLRIRELETNVSSAENLLGASGDFENEISTLQSVVEFHQQETRRLEADKSRLLEKLNQYEYAKTNDQMAMVPSAELSDLRSQVSLLEAAELKLDRLEQEEVFLKDAIDQLRAGKDACGHEFELEELKKKADMYNQVVKERDGIQRVLTSTKKAQALMRTNYEETKSQLATLQSRVKKGSVELKQTSSKAVQIKLTEEYTLKNLSAGDIYFAMDSSEEFKNALKNLGARHPEAYEDFVKLLQPSQKNISHVNVTSGASAMTLTAQEAGSQQMATPSSGRHKADISAGEESIVTVVKGRSINKDREMINKRAEKQFWKAVEGRRSQEVSDEEADHPHWTQVEKNMGDTEEMTLTVNFDTEGEGYGSDASNGGLGSLKKAKSCESVQSTGSQNSLPPPLPNQGPPTIRRSQSPSNESYYLPSADEASEIVDEDDLHPKRTRKYRQSNLTSRAKSMDRDSDFSEMTAPLSYNKKKTARSLDSIPDDSGYQEVDCKVLKDKISYLEEEIERKDNEIKEIKEKSVLLIAKDTSAAEQEKDLQKKTDNLQRQLETQQRVNKEGRMELDTRNREVQTLRMKIELLEKTRAKTSGVDSSPLALSLKPTTEVDGSGTVLKSKLDQKEKELQAKNNEVDRLTQELRGWQEDCRASKDAASKAEKALGQVQHQADCFLASQKTYEELSSQHNTLQREHDKVLSNQKHLEQASEDKAALEKVVVKLRSQLTDLERLEQEHGTYEAKVKALEDEVKHKGRVENQLSKENVKLHQLVDTLQRDNSEYRDMEKQYLLVTQQYKTMEEIKTKSQTMITPLRAKVLRLSQKCKHKNQLIGRLSLQLRKYEEGSEVLRDADAVKGEESEYNRPMSPLSSKALDDLEKQIKSTNMPRIMSSKKNKTSLNSSGNPGITNDHLAGGDFLRSSLDSSDVEDLLDPNLINGFHNNNNTKKGQFQQISPDSIPALNSQVIKRDHEYTSGANGSYNTDSVSDSLHMLNPPHLSYTPVTLLDSQKSSSQNTSANNTLSKDHSSPKKTQTAANFGLFKAVKDYDPSNFSRSGHPKLELPFREGDILKPLGAIDDKGYVEAELNGCVGLVPFNYLTPVHIAHPKGADAGARRLLPSVPQGQGHMTEGRHDSSPEQILKLHGELAASHVPNHTVLSTPPTSELSLPNGGLGITTKPPQQTGGGKKPQRSHSLTLSHPAFSKKPPIHPMTATSTLPRSRPTSQPSFNHQPSRNASPSLSLLNADAVLGSVSLPNSHRNTPVQDLSRPLSTPPTQNGGTPQQQPQPPSHFRVKRVVGEDGLLLCWSPPALDELARSNGIPVKGYKIYIDNKDSQHIPSPFMSKALIERLILNQPYTFTIQTLGEGGHTSSLVETAFTNVLPEDRDSSIGDGERSCAEYSQGGSSGSVSGERRVFMAVYDYSANTSTQAPHSIPELSFRTGDVVVCYGKPREDGYYYGKVHGKKGLVPASFIEEVAVIGSRAKRSHSSGSSALSPRYPPSTSSSQSAGTTTRNPRLKKVAKLSSSAKH